MLREPFAWTTLPDSVAFVPAAVPRNRLTTLPGVKPEPTIVTDEPTAAPTGQSLLSLPPTRVTLPPTANASVTVADRIPPVTGSVVPGWLTVIV